MSSTNIQTCYQTTLLFWFSLLTSHQHYRNSSNFSFLFKNLLKNTIFITVWRNASCLTARTSHLRCSAKKDVLRNFAKFTGKDLCQSFFFNKVAGLRPATLLKKRPWHRCFPVNFAKFLRSPFLQNAFEQLLLYSAKLKW